MKLIASYQNKGFETVADGIISFFNRRTDLHHRGIAFDNGANDISEAAKISTDISLVGIDRSDPEAWALSDVIIRGVKAGLNRYLKERPLFLDCCPEQSLFVNPIFNLQHYAPGEGFKKWHCDWATDKEATEPIHRVLAWILYCNDVHSAGTEFHWQNHYEEAERGKLLIFPAGLSHIHKGRVNESFEKIIATGWINAGNEDSFISRLANT
ncbi:MULTISPECIES: 2OG-Fe(II) oxygenase [Prochlorococcus]|uniref:2OG-Fe(II) oxygenase n=1 Tax=Prochlorococcus TaxID=1218 RepID=UPI0005339618|nr:MULTISPECIES: 2OG-Fe(II) oxygenase [Prochlorococcus]KGG12146.1 putative Trypsin [Prochlorococcus sp. MIT 0601]